MNMIEPGQSVVSDSVRLHDCATRDVAIAHQNHDAPGAKSLGASVTVAIVPDPSGLLVVGRESRRLVSQRERTSTRLAQFC